MFLHNRQTRYLEESEGTLPLCAHLLGPGGTVATAAGTRVTDAYGPSPPGSMELPLWAGMSPAQLQGEVAGTAHPRLCPAANALTSCGWSHTAPRVATCYHSDSLLGCAFLLRAPVTVSSIGLASSPARKTNEQVFVGSNLQNAVAPHHLWETGSRKRCRLSRKSPS